MVVAGGYIVISGLLCLGLSKGRQEERLYAWKQSRLGGRARLHIVVYSREGL